MEPLGSHHILPLSQRISISCGGPTLTSGVMMPVQVSIDISGNSFLYLCLIYEDTQTAGNSVSSWCPFGEWKQSMTSMTSMNIQEMHKGMNRSTGLLEARFCDGFCLLHLLSAGIRGNPHNPVCIATFNTSPGSSSYGTVTTIFWRAYYVSRDLSFFFFFLPEE